MGKRAGWRQRRHEHGADESSGRAPSNETTGRHVQGYVHRLTVRHNGEVTAPLGRAPRVITLVGPTASGKTSLSLDLAELIGGEVINADSMQVYRGMDIGTAKVPLSQRRGIAHHLIDLWEIDVPANVAEYQGLARACIDEIAARGRVPIIVGGSGLYVRAILDDLRFPGTDPELRASLLAELEQVGAVAMHARLAAVDAAAAAAILPTNSRRIVRALEVVELTGKAFTATLPAPNRVVPSLTVGLQLSRPELDARIDARVDRMWADGFVDEVRRLRLRGLATTPTARQALGYAQILAALEEGADPDTACQPTKAATRKFARRQMSWFLRDDATTWVDAVEPDAGTHIAALWEQSRVAVTA